MPSVAEYARANRVSEQRVRQLIRDGKIEARRVGSRAYVISDRAANARRPVSRPMSPRMAWGLIAALSNQELPANLAPAERSRIRAKSDQLRAHPAAAPALLASWMRDRGNRNVYRARPADLAHLARDPRLIVSGISHPSAGMSVSDAVEAWVADGAHVRDIADEYLLIPDPAGNVVLHHGAPWPLAEAPVGLVAADLADWGRPREDSQVVELIRGAA